MAPKSDMFNQIRSLNFLPGDISFKTLHVKDIFLELKMSLAMSMIFGRHENRSYSAEVFPWNSLKVSQYGTGFHNYETSSGTTPVSYSDSDELDVASGRMHRFDFNITAKPCHIRFWLDDSEEWGGDIHIPVGNSSLDFSSSKVQIKDQGTPGGTYDMVGYY